MTKIKISVSIEEEVYNKYLLPFDNKSKVIERVLKSQNTEEEEKRCIVCNLPIENGDTIHTISKGSLHDRCLLQSTNNIIKEVMGKKE